MLILIKLKKNILLDKICNKIIPIAIFIATTLNFVLSYFDLYYIYLGLCALGICLILIRGVNIKENDILILIFFIFYVLYISGHILFNPQPISKTIIGGGAYLMFPLYWFLLYKCKSNFDIYWLLGRTIPWVIIICFFALVQFYYSPNLFGFLDKSTSETLKWAVGENEKGNNYRIFLRATSFLSSPQCYGLFTILYLYIIYDFVHGVKVKIYSLLIFVAFCSMLSGNKISALILILFLYMIFMRLISAKKYVYIGVMMTMVILIVVTVYNRVDLEDLSAFNRIINYQDEDSNNERLDVYMDVLSKGNWLLGSGPGSYFINTTTVTESYLLQILLENGIIYFTSFILFFIAMLFFSYDKKITSIKFILISIFISMISAHTFTEPVFFIFWGIIFHSYSMIKFSTIK